MINSRKQLIAQISMMEKSLKNQQAKLQEHKNYLENTINYKVLLLVAALFPAFLVGWESARMGRKSHAIKHVLKFGFLKTLTHLV